MNKIGSFPAWRKFDKVVNLHLWRRVKGAGGGGGGWGVAHSEGNLGRGTGRCILWQKVIFPCESPKA